MYWALFYESQNFTYIYIYIYIHTHTHTHTHIYIYIWSLCFDFCVVQCSIRRSRALYIYWDRRYKQRNRNLIPTSLFRDYSLMRGLYIIPFINAFQQRLSTMLFSNAFQQRLSTTPFNNAFQQCLSTMPFNNIPTFEIDWLFSDNLPLSATV